jgi:hypothetical protein
MTKGMFNNLKNEIADLISKKPITQNIIEIGRHLKKIEIEKGYIYTKSITFDDWLESLDINIKKRNAYNYLRIYSLWNQKLKKVVDIAFLNKIGYSKILIIAREVEKETNPEKIHKMLQNIQTSARSKILHKSTENPPFTGTAIFHTFYKRTITLSDVTHRFIRTAGYDSVFRFYGKKRIKFTIEIIEKTGRKKT